MSPFELSAGQLKIEQTLHVEKVVLFVQRIVAIAKLHPTLKKREVEEMWFCWIAPGEKGGQGGGRKQSP